MTEKEYNFELYDVYFTDDTVKIHLLLLDRHIVSLSMTIDEWDAFVKEVNRWDTIIKEGD